MNIICWPWKITGEYSDGYKTTVGGNTEAHCMEQLASLQENHGDLVWYGGYCGDKYVEGEYIE